MFNFNRSKPEKQETIHLGRVAADAIRCIQCGLCGYNCPVGIPVRDYARQGLTVDDPTCISCGNCIQVCPRGTLRWETTSEQYSVSSNESKLNTDLLNT